MSSRVKELLAEYLMLPGSLPRNEALKAMKQRGSFDSLKVRWLQREIQKLTESPQYSPGKVKLTRQQKERARKPYSPEKVKLTRERKERAGFQFRAAPVGQFRGARRRDDVFSGSSAESTPLKPQQEYAIRRPTPDSERMRRHQEESEALGVEDHRQAVMGGLIYDSPQDIIRRPAAQISPRRETPEAERMQKYAEESRIGEHREAINILLQSHGHNLPASPHPRQPHFATP